ILFYQQRMQNKKIDTAVAQTEQWIQASMAYYVRNKKWPKNANSLIIDGYMPHNSQNSNPWCEMGCYEVKQRTPALIEIQVTIPEKNTGIRQAFTNRLVYTDSDAPAGKVIVLVNVPLSQIGRDVPALILTKVLPFTLFGADFRRGEAGKNPPEPWGFVTIGEGVLVGKNAIPKCSQLYGEDYPDEFRMFNTLVTAYQADQWWITTNPPVAGNQQPMFSLLNVFAVAVGEDIKVRAEARPQGYYQYGLHDPHLYAEINDDLRRAIQIQGYVSVFCKKKI
ncbi:MAG: hypothetical protein ACNA7Y_06535, partial [Gammaproteobacteria bacterium]